MNETDGRGGQPARIMLATSGGWGKDLEFSEQQFQRDAANFTMEALKSIGAPRKLYPQALEIVLEYRRMMRVHDFPQVTSDKNKPGLGRFAQDLKRRSEKMADQLDVALSDSRSTYLNDTISAGDLRSHMNAAWESLTAIVDLIDRRDRGVRPLSKAQIRHEAGSKLKALARAHGLKKMKFVEAFDIHPRAGSVIEVGAFNQWYQRLDG